MSLPFLLLLSVPLLLILAGAEPEPEPEPMKPRPQELRSPIQIPIREAQVGVRGCSYTVRIKTSCSSPRLTRDAISLAFGDAYRDDVYAPRLDSPSTRAFERCSTDTFKLMGPCGYGVCYLYLRRQGWDGWIPEWVQIYEPNGLALTFYYGSPLPNAAWYGYNHCFRRAAVRRTGGDQISQMY